VSVPAALVITSKDTSVAPQHQHDLAAAIGAESFEVPIDHLEVTVRADEFNPALIKALGVLASATEPETAAVIS
jgi:hypothetical protein